MPTEVMKRIGFVVNPIMVLVVQTKEVGFGQMILELRVVKAFANILKQIPK